MKRRRPWTTNYNKRPTKTRRTRATRRTYRRGYDRTTGFYGRFQPGGAEAKFFDGQLAITPVPNTGVILAPSINLIAAGTGEQQRIGRTCVVKSINIRGSLRNVNTSSGQKVRLIIFLDKQCNGAAATVAEIMENADVDSFRNLSNSQRFYILKDKTYVFQPNAYDVAGSIYAVSLTHVKGHKSCNIPLEFDGVTGAITEIRSNNIGILALSESSGAAPTIEFSTRIRFYDK